ncbi:aquaporin-like protein [Roridomyces roridus]|uniref:Aquaporin-like protein n=1 Tax=Roridomyces roridus TaxID=1738132 RepID=A0AAD7B7E0_9AGAR|nr:aquaporin-like protein [Roridomyces roridus]
MPRAVSDANINRIVYRGELSKRGRGMQAWERMRHGKAHWMVECIAEAMGVFFYVYAGVGSQAAYVVGGLIETPLSSLFQVGWAYAMGILFAITMCSATSGGHFNPAVTIVNCVLHGFPPLKGLRYICSQIFGGYIACLLIYVQYSTMIKGIEAATPAATLAAIQFTPNGPAGIFGNYLLPGSNIGHVFVNEFVVDFLLGVVICGCIDPSNVLIPPAFAPIVIALAYAAFIWGYAPIGLSANAARDLGGRFAALTIWGKGAVGSSKGYAALTALTNIPATLLGFIFYETLLADSDRVVPQANREFYDVHALHKRTGHALGDDDSHESEGKGHVGTFERV